jgi:hypothetical protein
MATFLDLLKTKAAAAKVTREAEGKKAEDDEEARKIALASQVRIDLAGILTRLGLRQLVSHLNDDVDVDRRVVSFNIHHDELHPFMFVVDAGSNPREYRVGIGPRRYPLNTSIYDLLVARAKD